MKSIHCSTLDVRKDMEDILNRIVPEKGQYRHTMVCMLPSYLFIADHVAGRA